MVMSVSWFVHLLMIVFKWVFTVPVSQFTILCSRLTSPPVLLFVSIQFTILRNAALSYLLHRLSSPIRPIISLLPLMLLVWVWVLCFPAGFAHTAYPVGLGRAKGSPWGGEVPRSRYQGTHNLPITDSKGNGGSSSSSSTVVVVVKLSLIFFDD